MRQERYGAPQALLVSLPTDTRKLAHLQTTALRDLPPNFCTFSPKLLPSTPVDWRKAAWYIPYLGIVEEAPGP